MQSYKWLYFRQWCCIWWCVSFCSQSVQVYIHVKHVKSNACFRTKSVTTLCVCDVCVCVLFCLHVRAQRWCYLETRQPFSEETFQKTKPTSFCCLSAREQPYHCFQNDFCFGFFFYFTYDVTEINDWIGWLEKSKKTNLFHKSYIKILYVLTELLLFFFYLLSSK